MKNLRNITLFGFDEINWINIEDIGNLTPAEYGLQNVIPFFSTSPYLSKKIIESELIYSLCIDYTSVCGNYSFTSYTYCNIN